MDFNPFGQTTDSLLYSWDEFESESFQENTEQTFSKVLELRIVENNYGIFANQYSIYGQPKESLDSFISSKDLVENDNLTSFINKVKHI